MVNYLEDRPQSLPGLTFCPHSRPPHPRSVRLNLAHVNLFHQKNRAILGRFKALEFPTWASTPNSPHRALERPPRSYTVDLPPNDLASVGPTVSHARNHGNTPNHVVRRYGPF